MARGFGLENISPLLSASITEFVLRPGKRIRPILFVLGYKSYCRSEKPGLYTSSLAMELLHDFMLIHDDIIDRSDTRRGKPSMHALLAKTARFSERIKFSGQDLAIVAGDVLYAMAVHTFLAIQEEPARKERGLKKFIEAALYTGAGEFIELAAGGKAIGEISESEIYTIYDYKTAFYTFASPLSIGATLAGAPKKETERLFSFGLYLGRAFQIQDDILGLYGNEKDIGKSTMTDLQEAKKTLLIWKAYESCGKTRRRKIVSILRKRTVSPQDAVFIKSLVSSTGALSYAREQIRAHTETAMSMLSDNRCIKPACRSLLIDFSRRLLSA